jgi:UDP-N-acetylmuramate--alanine ligase
VIRGDGLPPYEGPLSVAGAHNRQNAACAVAALELAGVARDEAAPALAEFTGAGRRLEHRGVAAGVDVFDDYAHHPAEIAATLAAARESDGRVLVLFQPHLYSRTRHLASELAEALSAADAVAVADVYRAREQPVAGVSGKLVVDALAEERPGMPLAWTPACDDGALFLARRARAGDRILTIGAGDVDRAASLLLELLR